MLSGLARWFWLVSRPGWQSEDGWGCVIRRPDWGWRLDVHSSSRSGLAIWLRLVAGCFSSLSHRPLHRAVAYPPDMLAGFPCGRCSILSVLVLEVIKCYICHSLLVTQTSPDSACGTLTTQRWKQQKALITGAVSETDHHNKEFKTMKKAEKPPVCLWPAFQEEA